MKNGGAKVQETEAERALAEVARERFADYKKRWQPLQIRAAELVKSYADPNSVDRQRIEGQANLGTRQAFTDADQKLEEAAQARGIRSGSARAKLGRVALDNAEATSQGIGQVGADQAMDQAYAEGLSKIMAMGRGQSSGAIEGMGTAARTAASRAQLDAKNALEDQMGNAELIGTVAGIGLDAASGFFKPKANPAMTSRAPSSVGINADPFAGV